jgi:antitoxin YefM
MTAITVKEAKRKLDSLINQVISDAEPAIILNEKGDKAVLLSLDEYNSWQETFYLLSNPVNAEHLRKSIDKARQGKFVEKKIKDLIDK